MGDCEAVYLRDDPATMVAQGKLLDAATTAELRERAVDEGGVELPTETLLRAAGLFMAEHGRPGVLAEIEDYLAEAAR